MTKVTAKSVFFAGVAAALFLGMAEPAATQEEGALVALRGEIEVEPSPGSLLARRAGMEVESVTIPEALSLLSTTANVSVAFSASSFPERVRVSCHCQDASMAEALDQILSRTEFGYLELGEQIVIAKRTSREATESLRVFPAPWRNAYASVPASASRSMLNDRSGLVAVRGHQDTGTITGRITEAGTSRPLSGVQVTVEDTLLGVLTNAEGRYMITGVPAGVRMVTVTRLGFREQTSSVTVQSGGTVALDFALQQEAIGLDAVVVTGSPVAARVREMPVSVAVIDAAEIEAMQIQRVDQLFNGRIPGAVAWDLGVNPGQSLISVRGRTSFGSDFIKTYIDGVEVANPRFLAQIDPQSIERIEVIRGPQASTLYGSDAIGGVLQIFTKKGQESERPQVRMSTSLRTIETGYGGESSRLVNGHNLSGEVSGGGEGYSYNVGANRRGVDGHIEDWSETLTSAYLGTRLTHGMFSLSATAQYAFRPHRFRESVPSLAEFVPSFAAQSFTDRFERQTGVGLALGFLPTDTWSHNVTIGRHQFHNGYNIEPRFSSPGDTLYVIADFNYSRLSLRYNTSLTHQLGSDVSATVTGGVDHWQYNFRDYFTNAAGTPSGMITPAPSGFTRVTWDDWNNTGYYGHLRVGFWDQLFLTGGIRAEDHDNFGEDRGLVWSPQVGATYLHPVTNDLDFRIRGAWGEAIRPPSPTAREGFQSGSIERLPNPDIGPETQSGWEAGVDLVFEGGSKLTATYYDQEVDGLIQTVGLTPGQIFAREQAQNVGQIRNFGWEFEGSTELAGVQLQGTYSIMRSTVGRLSPSYTGDLREGDDNIGVPRNMFAMSLGYDLLRGNARFEISRKGAWTEVDWITLYRDAFGFSGDPHRGTNRDYWMDFGPATRLHLRLSQDVSESLGVDLSIENLTDVRQAEPNNFNTPQGRAVILGLRYSH